MTPRAFLEQVLPADGLLIAARPVSNGWLNEPVADVGALLLRCVEWVWRSYDVYFAVASYARKRVWSTVKDGWETRTQANSLSIRCLFLDIDIKSKDGHYHTQEEALAALQAFCVAIGLPRPLLVSSGTGIHAYWPFETAVPTEEWKAAALLLKAATIHLGLKADRPLIANQACVLRVPGTYNMKRGGAAPVYVLRDAESHPFSFLLQRLQQYGQEYDLHVNRPSPRTAPPPPPASVSELGDNIGATNNPINPDQMAFHCAVFGDEIASRGKDATEPVWFAMLGLAKHCEKPLEVIAAVSDGHPNYDPAITAAKTAHWVGKPPRCATIHEILDVQPKCEACPHWRKITSPAQLGHTVPLAPPPQVETVDDDGVVVLTDLPAPPFPYKRTTKPMHAIVVEGEDANGNPKTVTIAPYDLYPIRLLRQTGIDSAIDERSVWRMHLPQVGPVDVDISMTVLTDQQRLCAFLMAKGYYVTPDQYKSIQSYMSAYTQHLAEKVKREQIYDRCGWHDNYHTYVMADEAYHRDGSITKHTTSARVKSVTKDGLHKKGTLAAWIEAIYFYDGYADQGYRFFIYAGFASILFHMTGLKGVLIAASGNTGRGKTTVLEAAASIYGNPEALKTSGSSDGTTVNALYNVLGTLHSLPLIWDETTEREVDEMRRFILNIPQGKGKIRMSRNGEELPSVTWEAMVLSSANTDDMSRILSSGKDSDPHLARMIGVHFASVNTSTSAKLRADTFKRRIHENYGHAGPLFIAYVVRNYEVINRRIISTMAKIDKALEAQSPERFWTAGVAAIIVAAEIAHKLGLIPFDYQADLNWMLDHVRSMRRSVVESKSSALELISEFLDEHFANALVLSTETSNIDNIARTPYGPLLVRHEYDRGVLYVSRDALLRYCTKVKTNFRNMETELKESGILEASVQKTLGAGTPYAKGQVRCWRLDATKMGDAGEQLLRKTDDAIKAGEVTPLSRKGTRP